MPIISKVNARSWQGKTVYAVIFVLLIAGAASMIYPFLLMLSGSVRTEADADELTIIPRFWKDDAVLFSKYAEVKYGSMPELQKVWGSRPPSYRKITPPADPQPPYLRDYLDWRAEAPWYEIGHSTYGRLLGKNARAYRSRLYEEHDRDLFRFRDAMKLPVRDWNQVGPPGPNVTRSPPLDLPLQRHWEAYSKTLPIEDRFITDPDASFVSQYLMSLYSPDITRYNKDHGTNHGSYDDIVLATRAPDTGLERTDWENYVRGEIKMQFIHLDDSLAEAYRAFLGESEYQSIDEYNMKFGTSLTSFDAIPFTTAAPEDRKALSDWEQFIQNPEQCPAESIEVRGPRQLFQAYLAEKHGLTADEVGVVRLPAKAADYHDLMTHKKRWRRQLTTQNYVHVLEYILRHGNGIKNTVIYCVLAIATALFVNPLAAYALSRYKPPSMYKILLFCMATMAFPGEVTMIPAFLLLKRFPLWPLVAGIGAVLLVFFLLEKTAKQIPEMLRLTVALAVGIVIGAWFVPRMAGQTHVSLLNTFWALVLPGAAQGFFIFLLKGFFDSLPQELYESAEIDGAGEWTKFWTITMNLSKPILAVIALNAFIASYSAFMMALIIIPDPDMWTLMVWVFQLQSTSHQSVLYASLVITAIPTFLVFAFCQNIIIRGIVVPVEK